MTFCASINIQNQAPSLCYIRKQQGTSLQGIGLPDNWRNSRALTQSSGFFHGEHGNAKHGHPTADCVGASKDAPVPIAGSPTRHSLSPSTGLEGGGLSTCQLEAVMPKIKTGATAQTTPTALPHEAINKATLPRYTQPAGTSHPERIVHPPRPAKSVDLYMRFLLIDSSLTRASQALRAGSLSKSLGATMAASRHLKQAVIEATTSGRSAS